MRFVRWILLLIVLLIAGSTAAQDAVTLTKTYNYPDGKTTFQYPDGWKIEAKEGYLVDIYTSTTTIYFADFAFFQANRMTKRDTLEDALKNYFDTFYDKLTLDTDKIETLKVGGRDASRYDYVIPEGKLSAFMLAVRFSDDTFGLIEAVSEKKDFPQEDAVLAVAATFDIPGESSGSSDAGSGVPCTVTTSADNAVHIRVGPGTNRTSFAFLPADTDFTVLGKATDKSGGIWWKLDKETVAPGKSAAEAWVSADDVDSSGDCEAVVDVNAPPVIPIVGGGSPPISGGGGGDTSGGAEPGSGSWTVTYAPTAPGSCAGGSTVNIPLDYPPERASVSGGGSSMTFDGDVFSRISAGVYQGLYSAPDGTSVLATLRVASTTLMSIEYIYNFQIDGTPCSITVNGTVSHN
jgi:hypothetical protein